MDQVTTHPAPRVESADPTSRSGVFLAALVMAAIVVQLCGTMSTPAIPDMVNRLHTTGLLVGLSQAFFYLVGGLVAIIISGYSDYSDSRKLLVGSLVVMCLGLVLATFAPDIGTLIIARVLQGASGAVFPLALRILRETLSPQKFGQAMGIITAAYGGVAGVDAIVGGWLTDAYGFRAVFAAMTAFGVVTTAVVVWVVPSLPRTSPGRMDWWGATILCLSLAAIEMGIGSASNANAATIVSFLVIGLVLFVVFWNVEKRRAHPLVPTRYLRSRQAWPVLVTSILTTAGVLSVINYIVPVIGQDRHSGYGLSATMTSLIFIVPICVINVVCAPIAGNLAPRIGWRRTLWGALLCSVPVLIVLGIGLDSRWLAAITVAVLGIFGLAAALTAMNGLSVILSPQENPGLLPGINSTCFGIGASLGVALASQLATRGAPGGALSLAGFQKAMWMSVIAVALAVLTSLLISGRAAARDEKV